MADDKIQEAEHFLNEIKSFYLKAELRFKISAFLSATRSISDHLLEEYNTKLGLNIPLTDKLYPNIFEREARAKNNSTAISFIGFFNQEVNKVAADPVAGFLARKRDINIHRKTNDIPLHASVTIHETLGVSDSLTIKVLDKDGNPIRTIENNPEPPSRPPPTPPNEIKYYFGDYPQDDIITVCTQYLTLMKAFVNNIRQAYP